RSTVGWVSRRRPTCHGASARRAADSCRVARPGSGPARGVTPPDPRLADGAAATLPARALLRRRVLRRRGPAAGRRRSAAFPGRGRRCRRRGRRGRRGGGGLLAAATVVPSSALVLTAAVVGRGRVGLRRV